MVYFVVLSVLLVLHEFIAFRIYSKAQIKLPAYPANTFVAPFETLNILQVKNTQVKAPDSETVFNRNDGSDASGRYAQVWHVKGSLAYQNTCVQ